MESLMLAFIPVFVAVDPIGMLPIFVGLTHGLDQPAKRNIIVQSMFTAIGLAVSFVLLGKAIFRFLGITVGDFMIAGGAILFCIAIIELLRPGRMRRHAITEDLGVVPIGTPLVVGPAVLTTSLIVADQHGIGLTLISVMLNITIVGIVFVFSDNLIKLIGESGSRALSKIMALLLAAIAVMMIRRGVMTMMGMPAA